MGGQSRKGLTRSFLSRKRLMMKVYFVSYSSKSKEGKLGFGNASVTRNTKIVTVDDYRAVQEEIAKTIDAQSVIILNFFLLHETE